MTKRERWSQKSVSKTILAWYSQHLFSNDKTIFWSTWIGVQVEGFMGDKTKFSLITRLKSQREYFYLMACCICTHVSFRKSISGRCLNLFQRIWLFLGKHSRCLLLCPPANHPDVCLSTLYSWGRVILHLHLHDAMILEWNNKVEMKTFSTLRNLRLISAAKKIKIVS